MTTPLQPPEPKHTAYNRKLLHQILVKEKHFSRYPRVSEQVECLPLETDKLFAHAYNPTINARGEMVYRFHKGDSKSTKLARAILGPDNDVLLNNELVIAGGISGEDDGKLWTFNGEQYLSWVESDWAQTGVPTGCVTKYAKFNDGIIRDIQQPRLPDNDGNGWCKNLVFFDRDNGFGLNVVFQCHPTQRIYNLTTGSVYETDGPRWAYGDIRGGTAPLPYEGKLLRFFHSRINHDIGGVAWRYFLGAYLMEPEPPFKVLSVSKKPIVYASEICGVKKKDCHHFKENVVFPGGAIETTGGWIVALGVNDCEIALAKITPSMLNL